MATHSELLARHKRILPEWMVLYYEDPIAIVDGEGRHVVDAEGNRYLDFFGGILTTMTGYRVPEVVNAIREQAGKMLHKPDLNDYLQEVIKFVAQLKVGILKPRALTDEQIVVGLDECITCSGMDNIGKRICHFETGFVAGVVESFIGDRVRATETKCGANGEGICEVTVDLIKPTY